MLRLKKAASLFLVVLIVAAAMLGTTYALEGASSRNSDYLYYSDIFWGYPRMLTRNLYYSNYISTVRGSMGYVIRDYVDSDHFKLSAVGKGLEYGTDWGEYLKYLSDQIAGTSFVENAELDAANKKLAEALFSVDTSGSASLSAPTKWFKAVKSATGAADKIEKYFEAWADKGNKTVSVDDFPVIFDEVMDRCEDTKEISVKGKGSIIRDMLVGAGEAANVTKTVHETASFLKAFVLSVEIADAQLDILQDIIDTQNSNTMLYKGLSRLKSQLKYGFGSYFVSTYVSKKLYSDVVELVRKGSLWMAGNIGATYTAVTAVVGVLKTVIVDIFLDANYEDYTTALILYKYANDLSDSLEAKAEIFLKSFTYRDIEEYESMYMTMLSVDMKGIEHFKKLAKYNKDYTVGYLENAVSAYVCDDVSEGYNQYINGIRDDYANASEEWIENCRSYHESFTLSEGMSFSPMGSDQMDSDTIYCVNGLFNGNIRINGGTFTIPEGSKVTVSGSITMNTGKINNSGDLTVNRDIQIGSGTLTILEGSKVIVTGNITANTGRLKNCGELTVAGDVYNNGNSGYIEMDTERAIFRIGGNLSLYHTNYSKITAGTVVFNGTSQQAVKDLIAYNVEVTNPEGIKYETDVYIHGEYDLHGNPLDNASHWTNMYENTVLKPGSNYRSIRLMKSNSISIDGLTVEDICIYSGNSSLIADDGKISGDIQIVGTLTIPEGSKVTVTGNITANTGRLKNCGELIIVGDVYNNGNTGYIEMDTERAIFQIGGNLSLYHTNYSNITAGTVIFNGTGQQTVMDLEASTVILENQSEEGVVFTTPITVSMLFDHRGNNFTLYENGRGSSFTDYDGDGMKDNVDPEPTVPGSRYTLSGTVVTVRLNDLPDDCTVIAARYDSLGRMEEVFSVAPDPASNELKFEFSSINTGDHIKVFSLDDSMIPLEKAMDIYINDGTMYADDPDE